MVLSTNARERSLHPSVARRRLVDVGLVDDEEDLNRMFRYLYANKIER